MIEIPESIDVVVIGSGPSGGVSALALRHLASEYGYGPESILVLEKRSVERGRSNTLLLDELPVRALENIGCDISTLTPSCDFTLINPDASILNRYPLPVYRKNPKNGICFNASFMLRRRPVFNVGINELERVILEAIGRKKEISVLHESELIDIETYSTKGSHVTFVHNRREYKVAAKYVIVADGAKSATLSALGFGERVRSVRLETVISSNFKQPGRGNTKYHSEESSFEALSLASKQGTSVFVKIPVGSRWDGLRLSVPEERIELVKLLREGAAKLGVSGDIGVGLSVLDLKLDQSSRSIIDDNIFVIGDARHSSTPRIGLGANVAMMDAIRAAHTIIGLHALGYVRRKSARRLFKIHSWFGALLLHLLGRAIKAGSYNVHIRKTNTYLPFTAAVQFWKGQLLMSFHWRAFRGQRFNYSDDTARESLDSARY